MTHLPALVTAESAVDGTLDLSASPRGRPSRLGSSSSLPAIAARRPSLLPPLSITTASSLRPARVRAATAPDTAAAPSATPAHDAVEASAHPLLCQLVQDAAPMALAAAAAALEDPAEAAATAPPSHAPSVAEAVEALGGPDAVEALFVQLRGVACADDAVKGEVGEGEGNAAERGGDVAFAAAVAACIRAAFHVTAVTLDAADLPVAMQRSREDPPSVEIAIPLDVADSSAAARSQHRRGGPSASTRSRHYLVLRVARHRGVLALHIVDLRLPEALLGRWHQPPPPTTSLSRRLGHSAAAAETESPSAPPPPPPTRQTRPRSQRGTGAAAAAAAGLAAPVPAALSSVQVDIAPRALLTAAELNASTTSSPPRQRRRGTGKRRLGHAHHTSAAAVPFDPSRPEATTPFNESHRPVTYNAAIAFQTYT